MAKTHKRRGLNCKNLSSKNSLNLNPVSNHCYVNNKGVVIGLDGTTVHTNVLLYCFYPSCHSLQHHEILGMMTLLTVDLALCIFEQSEDKRRQGANS